MVVVLLSHVCPHFLLFQVTKFLIGIFNCRTLRTLTFFKRLTTTNTPWHPSQCHSNSIYTRRLLVSKILQSSEGRLQRGCSFSRWTGRSDPGGISTPNEGLGCGYIVCFSFFFNFHTSEILVSWYSQGLHVSKYRGRLVEPLHYTVFGFWEEGGGVDAGVVDAYIQGWIVVTLRS